jgi:hypothetical protein
MSIGYGGLKDFNETKAPHREEGIDGFAPIFLLYTM